MTDQQQEALKGLSDHASRTIPSALAATPIDLDRIRQDREERIRQEDAESQRIQMEAAVKAFTPWRGSRTGAWVCPGCGSLVADRETHINFHGRISRAVQDAESARVWNTPIG